VKKELLVLTEEGWVTPTTSLKVLEKRTMSCLCQEFNPGLSCSYPSSQFSNSNILWAKWLISKLQVGCTLFKAAKVVNIFLKTERTMFHMLINKKNQNIA
jgi:hypothetical protein